MSGLVLKLILYLLVAILLGQIWRGLRRAASRERDAPSVRRGPDYREHGSEPAGIDRSQVVDAEFEDVDDGGEASS